jgi:hypothetical protein
MFDILTKRCYFSLEESASCLFFKLGSEDSPLLESVYMAFWQKSSANPKANEIVKKEHRKVIISSQTLLIILSPCKIHSKIINVGKMQVSTNIVLKEEHNGNKSSQKGAYR